MLLQFLLLQKNEQEKEGKRKGGAPIEKRKRGRGGVKRKETEGNEELLEEREKCTVIALHKNKEKGKRKKMEIG